MTLSDQQIRALVYLAKDCRPTGARQWSEDKLYAEIAKLRGRSLGAVVLAVTRAAMDRNAQRPEVISSAGSHWSDTMLAQDFVPDSIPDDQKCSICGFSKTTCNLANPVDHPLSHEFDSVAAARKRREERTPQAVKGAVDALKDELAHTDPRPAPSTGLTTEGKPELAERLAAIVGNNQGLQAPPMQETNEEAG